VRGWSVRYLAVVPASYEDVSTISPAFAARRGEGVCHLAATLWHNGIRREIGRRQKQTDYVGHLAEPRNLTAPESNVP